MGRIWRRWEAVGGPEEKLGPGAGRGLLCAAERRKLDPGDRRLPAEAAVPGVNVASQRSSDMGLKPHFKAGEEGSARGGSGGRPKLLATRKPHPGSGSSLFTIHPQCDRLLVEC